LCKRLGKEETKPERIEKLGDQMKRWVNELKETDFPEVGRIYFNLLVKKGMQEKFTTHFFDSVDNKQFQENSECFRILKSIFEKLTEDQDLPEKWGKELRQKNTKINNVNVGKWIKGRARKGPTTQKQKWERFEKEFTTPPTTTRSQKQQCSIQTTRTIKNRENPSSIVVWNGNGMRARWNSPTNELKRLVHATKPDLLCIIRNRRSRI